MRQFTPEEAIIFGEHKLYECLTDDQIVDLQMNQKLCCVPLIEFKKALENVLKRPIMDIELMFTPNKIRQEYFDLRKR